MSTMMLPKPMFMRQGAIVIAAVVLLTLVPGHGQAMAAAHKPPRNPEKRCLSKAQGFQFRGGDGGAHGYKLWRGDAPVTLVTKYDSHAEAVKATHDATLWKGHRITAGLYGIVGDKFGIIVTWECLTGATAPPSWYTP